MRKIPKDFARLVKPYLDAGLVVVVDGSKHRCLVRPDGHKRPIPGSPSDHRALSNFKVQLRQFAGPLPQEPK